MSSASNGQRRQAGGGAGTGTAAGGDAAASGGGSAEPAAPAPTPIKAPPMPPTASSSGSVSRASLLQHVRKLPSLLRHLQRGVYERDGELRLATLCALAGEHIILLGPPGTGKSMISRRVCDAFQVSHSSQFKYLMTAFTRPDELFGPYSLKGLQNDKQIRKVDGYLPKAVIAFLDEIFKASSEILNSLLSILEDRVLHNGNVEERVPLLFLVAASNEQPQNDEAHLQALYDRFLVRRWVSYVTQEHSFRAVVGLPNAAGKMSPSPDEAVRLNQSSIPLSAELQAALKREVRAATDIAFPAEWQTVLWSLNQLLKRDLHKDGTPEMATIGVEAPTAGAAGGALAPPRNSTNLSSFLVSDRRWRKIVYLIRLSAFVHAHLLQGQYGDHAAQVSLADLYLLTHCTWRQDDELSVVQSALHTAARPIIQTWMTTTQPRAAPVQQSASASSSSTSAATAASSSASSSSVGPAFVSGDSGARLEFERMSVRMHVFLSRADKQRLAKWLGFTLNKKQLEQHEQDLCTHVATMQHREAADRLAASTERTCTCGHTQNNPLTRSQRTAAAAASFEDSPCAACGAPFPK